MKIFTYSKPVFLHEKLPLPERRTINDSLKSRRLKGKTHLEKKRRIAEELRRHKQNLENRLKVQVRRIGPKEVPIEYTLLARLQNETQAKEVAFMTRLIKNYWGGEKAKEIHDKAWKGDKFDINVYYEHFKKGRKHPNSATEKLGFYYWAEKGKWYVYNDKPGSSDEPVGEYIYKSVSALDRKFRSSTIQFLNRRDTRMDIVKKLKSGVNFVENVNATFAKKSLYAWFMKKPEGRLIINIPPKILGLLYVAFNARDAGRQAFMRYKNKIYFVNKDGNTGYIQIENRTLTGFKDSNEGLKLIRKEVFDKMSTDQVMQESLTYKLKSESLSVLKPAEVLLITKGVVAGLRGIPKRVEYNKLRAGYLDIVEKKLKEKLKDEYPNNYEALAAARVKKIEQQIENKRKNDDALRQALDKNPNERIDITVASDDTVTVSLTNRGLYNKFARAAKKIKEKAVDAKDLSENTYKDLMTKIEKRFGKRGPVITWFLNTFFKMKEGIAKLWTGGSAPLTAFVLGIFGIKITKGALGSKKIESAKDLEEKFKRNKILKKTFFSKDTRVPSNMRLVIPKSKGIKPGKAFNVEIRGKGFMVIGPKDLKGKKEKKSFFGLFKRSKSAKYLYVDDVVTIRPGTVIPKGTLIQGARLERV